MPLQSEDKKKRLALVSVLVLLLGGLYFNRALLAESVWRIFHNAPTALFLNDDAEFAVLIGNYYFNVDGGGVYDLEKAKYYFGRALSIDPLVPDAWHQLARIDFLGGNFDRALFKINKQIELHGENHMASYYIRGLIHGYSGESNEAVDDFLTFLKWDPINWAVYNDLAWIYFQEGNYESAERIAQQGLGYFPDNPWLLNIRGISLLNLGNKTEAENSLIRALEEARKLTVYNWAQAYPGNDPNIAESGLAAMIEAIEFNLALTGD